MISVNNISIIFSGDFLFDNVSFNINPNDRIGLVGKNGAGKTTLLKIIADLQTPETGEVVIPDGFTIGYLPQEKILSSSKTIYDEANTAFNHIIKLEKQIEKLNAELAERDDYESKSYLSVVKKLNDITEQHNMLGGNSIEADIEKILLGLGFERTDFIRPMTEFSGGWQMRVELAKILLQRPNLILLDEPTNHLDIESIQWLESFLSTYNGAVILVSHDRAFLDSVSNRTIEIVNGNVYDYKASYSDFATLREERIEHQKAAFTNQQRQVEQIQRFVERFRYKASKAKQVQSKIKMLDKMEEVDIDDKDTSNIHFKFPPAPHSGKIVIEANDASKWYGEHEILHKLSFIIEKNAKVAFVGKNGEGKTTLVKMINREVDFTGEIKTGQNVRIGYYAQDQAHKLNPEKTVFETIDDIATGDMRKQVRNILGSFLFSGESIDKKVKVLSGGEKSRLALACMLLEPVNLLILDEPTNHLDMTSKDILKNALILFDGTLIIVSHDRDFLQGLTDRVYEFRKKSIREHKGDIYDFLESRRLSHLNDLNKVKAEKTTKKEDAPSENKVLYLKRKEHEKAVRKVKKDIERCEHKIERFDEELHKMDEMMKNPSQNEEQLNDADIFTQYQQLKEEQEKTMSNWEKLQEELEEIENNKPE